MALIAAALGLGACNGGAERAGERAGQDVKEDIRGMRDFLRERGITVDTRLPER
ncbi:MAG TPA: hypothetical protein VIF14_18715 [Alphaproteobacteria bacterium]